MQKIVTSEVRKVMVETWQPSPLVRNSKRSGPVAQMNLYRRGESSGNAFDNESLGRGRQVPDYMPEVSVDRGRVISIESAAFANVRACPGIA